MSAIPTKFSVPPRGRLDAHENEQRDSPVTKSEFEAVEHLGYGPRLIRCHGILAIWDAGIIS